MSKRIHTLVLMLLVGAAGYGQDTISLYNLRVPNYVKNNIEEFYEPLGDNNFHISLVDTPEMYVYKPEKKSEDVTSAVLICPGGGYKYLSFFHEGVEVAEWFAKRGVLAAILKSRLPDDRLMSHKEDVPLMDAKQAIGILRKQAKQLNIDPNRIGVMGFSAGGHLAASLSTHYGEGERPDFSILIYPVISMKKGLTHMGSRIALLGENPDEALVEKYSNETQITPNTPPSFLIHASNDGAVPYENSLLYYQKLIDNGVKQSEMHIFPSGGHGFWMAKGRKGTIAEWPDLMEAWLLANGWMVK